MEKWANFVFMCGLHRAAALLVQWCSSVNKAAQNWELTTVAAHRQTIALAA